MLNPKINFFETVFLGDFGFNRFDSLNDGNNN